MTTLTINSDEPIVVIKLSEYEALLETLDILSDEPSILAEIEESKLDLVQGKGISFQDYLKKRKK